MIQVSNVSSISAADLLFVGAVALFAFEHFGLPHDAASIKVCDGSETRDQISSVQEANTKEAGRSIVYNYRPGDSRELILEAVAHETVHINQFHTGRLAYTMISGEGYLEWGLKWQDQAFFFPRNEQDYLNSPWEVEAREESAVIRHGFVFTNGGDIENLFNKKV